jgi:hypothetical protein
MYIGTNFGQVPWDQAVPTFTPTAPTFTLPTSIMGSGMPDEVLDISMAATVPDFWPKYRGLELVFLTIGFTWLYIKTLRGMVS